MIDKSRFANTCGEYGISLTARQLDMFDKYREILVEYNEKVNLTAITDPVGIENKHFLDSLLFAKNPLVEGKVVDVGTGGGFPRNCGQNIQAGNRAYSYGTHRKKMYLFTVCH